MTTNLVRQFGWLVFGVAIVGCGKTSEPVAKDSSAPQPAKAESVAVKSPARVTPVEKTVAKTTTPIPDVSPPRSNGDGLRQKIARLAIPDEGRWRVDKEIKQQLDLLGPDIQSQVIPLLADDSVAVRRGAAFYLAGMDMRDPAIAEAFTATLADEDAAIRHMGLQAINGMPIDVAAAAADKLAALVARPDESSANRSTAARAIGKLGAAGSAALPDVKNAALTAADPQVRKTCLFTVSKIASPNQAVEIFRQSLTQDEDLSVRRAAAVRLRFLGAAAAPAARDLAAALEIADDDLRKDLFRALIAIGGPAVEPLIGKLKSPNAPTRRVAAYVLGQLGEVAKPALPALRQLRQDDNLTVRDEAEQAILAIETGQ